MIADDLPKFYWYRFRIWLSRLPERLKMWLAWALPEDVVYFATVRVAARATCGKYGNNHPDEVSVMEALRRWTVNPVVTPSHSPQDPNAVD